MRRATRPGGNHLASQEHCRGQTGSQQRLAHNPSLLTFAKRHAKGVADLLVCKPARGEDVGLAMQPLCCEVALSGTGARTPPLLPLCKLRLDAGSPQHSPPSSSQSSTHSITKSPRPSNTSPPTMRPTSSSAPTRLHRYEPHRQRSMPSRP